MINKNLEAASIDETLAVLENFVNQMKSADTLSKKLEVATAHSLVADFLSRESTLKDCLDGLTPECELMYKVILALGQGRTVFANIETLENKKETFRSMLEQLYETERFYDFMGGLTGYYYITLKLIAAKHKGMENSSTEVYLHPPGPDISQDSAQTRAFVRAGIEKLPLMVAFFPVGGAGDRLDLRDETSGEPLPAAYLPFGGFSLLEGLIRDLQSLEFLYWKLHDRQLATPITMMTSHEKGNHKRIGQIISQHGHFGRPVDSLKCFIQPLVPVITEDGCFSLSAPLELKLKPGGHGVIWKLALENSLFDWAYSKGKEKLLIRQINNPIAGTDSTLLAFYGAGCANQKKFGFASCQRLINSSEGMLVLGEVKSPKGYQYCIKNIEYTDFQAKGIKDLPSHAGTIFSAFPANTNILFADLKSIQPVVERLGIPGLLINMKSKVPFIDESGMKKEVYGGRLESMMQSLGEMLVDEFPQKLESPKEEQFSSFVTYGERRKVISVTKNQFTPGKSCSETPEGCLYDQLLNCHELFTRHCHFNLPDMPSEEQYLQQGPTFIVRYHPALGPLYQIISQKIQGGALKQGAELILEASEVSIRELTLEGSLIIRAKAPLGNLTGTGLIEYSEYNGKCELHNVKVVNRGIDWRASNCYWKNSIQHHEKMEIILHGNAEFYAKDVCLEGNMRIEVPAGSRMEMTNQDGQIKCQTLKIKEPTWQWHYKFDQENAIQLSR